MTAETATPLDTVMDMAGNVPIELQPAADGTILAVCGACGFQWDADHKVTDAEGRTGYECARCTLGKAVEALAAQGERLDAAAGVVNEVLGLRAEVEHLRPQNALLKKESSDMRTALRQHAIQKLGIQGQWCCLQCKGTWMDTDQATETHLVGCLAEAP